jgi:peptidoglycan/LPS O-acetylase OafA/YrhL
VPDSPAVTDGDVTERRWIPFDGLRALLVMGVMAHHVEWNLGDTTPIFEAGWLPVDGFFVLSGFLITNALIREFDVRGTIDIAGFLARRLARLYPALLAVLAAIAVVALVADDRPFGDVWPSLASSASLGHNFNYRGVSPLLTEVGPFWSLGIEFQFYIVFPFVALGLLTAGASRRVWLTVLVAVIVVSATWRALLGVERFPDSYMWTHVRLDSITWGVLIAVAMYWGRLQGAPARVVRAVAAASLVALVWIYLNLGGFDARTYDWGITVAGLASAGVVAALLLLPTSTMARLFSWRPLVELGKRSYSAYLWHQLVFLFLVRHTSVGQRFRPDGDRDWLLGFGLAAVGYAVTFVLADLTYRFVEQPLLAWSRRWSAASRQSRPSVDSVGLPEVP